MKSDTNRLSLDEILAIVRATVKSTKAFTDLPDDEKRRVCFGSSMKKNVARSIVYVPREPRELGTIVGVYDVDREKGTISIVPEAEW